MRATKINGILLDTSFILPSFGVEVTPYVMNVIRLLRRLEEHINIYYSTFNLVEALVVIIREVRKGRLDAIVAEKMISSGISVVTLKLQRAREVPQVYSNALRLYSMGHKDLFDNLIYSIALANGLRLLTVDKELREFLRANNLEDVTIMPNELRGVLTH
ncbi:MAG: PIN domain nuclease [Thermoprotei archaeon]|nr:MAG: PIN domain nuclease [Thermoprotei archaeon]RLF21760.1 MAG: PIN domain nuclease [Thermoprotei archaeon]